MARVLDFGGIERDVSKFARHLSSYGIEPHVACFNPGGVRWREIQAAGVPVLHLPVTSFKSKSTISAAKILKTYVSDHKIKVIHAFDDGADVFGVAIGRILKVPVTISSQLGYRTLSSLKSRVLLALTDRFATGHFVNCEAVADNLVRTWKVPRKNIHVCYNGFEQDEFYAKPRSRPPQLAEASLVIGTVALLREEKNLSMLVEAFASVHTVDPNAKLLIVGSGPLRESLAKQIQNLGLSNSCILEEATKIPAAWMRAIDVFVLTSRTEAFPNALLEAMACGCCPVASRVGGVPELIRHGETGLLFEAGNVPELAELLSKLTSNEVRRRQLANAACDFAHQNLTIDVAALRLASIYRHLLKSTF